MGGRGSTRWNHRGDYVPALATNDAFEIRATRLFRIARPERGRTLDGRLEGTASGPVTFTIDATGWPVTLHLHFSPELRAAGLSIPNDTSIWLLSTETNYGGERWWFVCPACGSRCAVVYLVPRGYSRAHGMPWACRACQGLVYLSQRQGSSDRALRKLRKVLNLAGAAWTANLLPRHRPKGMHRRTFDRLYAEATVALMAASASRRTAKVLRTGALWG